MPEFVKEANPINLCAVNVSTDYVVVPSLKKFN